MVAPCVSSDRWADASNPVIVYCVSRKPSGRMYHQYMLSEKPELLIVSVKTNDGDWYSFAVSSRISTTAAAPNTCQYAEMLLTSASRCELKMLISDVITIRPTNSRNDRTRKSPVSFQPEENSPIVTFMNVAQAYVTDAVTPTRPTRLSQP